MGANGYQTFQAFAKGIHWRCGIGVVSVTRIALQVLGNVNDAIDVGIIFYVDSTIRINCFVMTGMTVH